MDRFRFERILVIVDIQDAISQPNPAGYTAALDQFVRYILGSGDALWAFKFFDSSVGSCSSNTRVFRLMGGPNSSHFRSFRRELSSYTNFQEKLHSLAAQEVFCERGEPKAAFVSTTIKEVFTDLTWDPLHYPNEELNSQYWQAKPNLILLFSSMPTTSEKASSFLGLEFSAERTEKQLEKHFLSSFESLNRSFAGRNIHSCWVQSPERCSTQFQRRCFAQLGWSFTDLDTFVISSLVVPRSLILPCVTWSREFILGSRRLSAGLKVNLLDKESRTMQLPVCRVDMAFLKEQVVETASLSHKWAKIKILVEAVLPREQLELSALQRTQRFFLWPSRSKQSASATPGSVLLQRLQQHPDETTFESPGLQLLCVYLARMDAVGLAHVEVSSDCGSTKCMRGVLDPLTIHTAILYSADSFGDINSFLKRERLGPRATKRKSNDTSTALLKRPKARGSSTLFLSEGSSWSETWNSYLALVQTSEVNGSQTMEELICPGEIKGLASWVKQVRKSCKSSLLADVAKWLGVDLTLKVEPANDLPAGSVPGPGSQERSAALDMSVAEAEAYVSSVKEKLSGFMHCSDMDMQSLARKIVRDTLTAVEVLRKQASGTDVRDAKQLILEQPDVLNSKYSMNRSQFTPEQMVKEYIFQIKLRLELIAIGQQEERLVSDICDLLSFIQFRLPGSFFEMEGLRDFSDRIIYSCYNKDLPAVVKEIYKKMELDGFDDENEDGVNFPSGCSTDSVDPVPRNQTRSRVSSPGTSSRAPSEQLRAARERARRNSHFSCRSQKLRVVRKRSPVRSSSRSSKSTRSSSPIVDFVAATPMTSNCSTKTKDHETDQNDTLSSCQQQRRPARKLVIS